MRTANINVTFSIPENIKEKQQSLRAAYVAVNNDPDRKNMMEDWTALDNEGWDE